MSATLLLDRTTWDLLTDASGNIAMATTPYATAQDVASVCRLFSGEYWYDTTLGLPYFTNILGQQISVSYLKTQYEAAALTVPNVATAKFIASGISSRMLTGQIQATDTSGAALTPVTVKSFSGDFSESFA
jgi:hypothetical protein